MTGGVLLGTLQLPSLLHYSQRLKTFNSWSPEQKPNKVALAMAGFFYMGTEDWTMCIWCGVRLRKWEVNDVPFQEHYKWSCNCPYLQMVFNPSIDAEASYDVVDTVCQEKKNTEETKTPVFGCHLQPPPQVMSDKKMSSPNTMHRSARVSQSNKTPTNVFGHEVLETPPQVMSNKKMSFPNRIHQSSNQTSTPVFKFEGMDEEHF